MEGFDNQKRDEMRTPQGLGESDQNDISPSPDTLLGGRDSEFPNYPPKEPFTLSYGRAGEMESRNQAKLVVASTKQLKHDGSRKATRTSQPGRNTDLEGILDGGTSRGNTVEVQPSDFVCEPRTRSPNMANGLESGAASVTSMTQIYKEQQVQTEAKSRSVLERRVQSNQGSKRVTPGGSGHIQTLNIANAKAQFSQKTNESEKAKPNSGSADVTQGDLKSPELQKHTLLANYVTHGSWGEELKEEFSEKSPLRTPSTKGTIQMKDQ